jgi:dihydroxyacetone kinase-like predicted kinase
MGGGKERKGKERKGKERKEIEEKVKRKREKEIKSKRKYTEGYCIHFIVSSTLHSQEKLFCQTFFLKRLQFHQKSCST